MKVEWDASARATLRRTPDLAQVGCFLKSIRLDFGKLHNVVAGNDPSRIRRATLFGSRPPKNDSLWQIARSAGFETIIVDRNVANREKKIDTGIVAAMIRLVAICIDHVFHS